MIHKTPQNEIDTYYQSTALNQSRLKLLLSGIEFFKNSGSSSELYFQEKDSFITGSGVDCLLTSTKEDFENRFYISKLKNKPSDLVKSIINMAFDNMKNTLGEVKDMQTSPSPTYILQACNAHNYQPGYKDSTKVSKICEYSEYWEELRKSEGKTILSVEEYNLILKIESSFRSGSKTSPYFLPTSGKNCDIFYQKPLYFTYKGVQCKALPDIIVVRHFDDYSTIEIVDIKTTAYHPIDFPIPLRKYRYDIQAAWYKKAVESNKDVLGVQEDDEIKEVCFLVDSTLFPRNPIKYICNDELLNIGEFGRNQLKANNILVKPKIKGFAELVDEYIYYEKQGWIRDKRLDSQKGVLELNWDGIIENK